MYKSKNSFVTSPGVDTEIAKNINDNLFVASVGSLQYFLIYQGTYQEKGSVAALNIVNKENLGIVVITKILAK